MDDHAMPTPLPAYLTELSPWRSIAALMLDWGLIAASFGCAVAFPSPLIYLAAAIVIARTQLALAVLMHESAHRVLTRNARVNDVIGQVFAAAPLMLSLYSYRRGHMQHHRAPMASDDPVAVVFGIADYPVSRSELVWRLFKDVTAIGYFLSVWKILRASRSDGLSKPPPNRARTLFVIASIVLTNAALIGALTALEHPALYVGLWLLPALTLLQLFARVRAITEHAGYGPCEDQIQNARTIVRPNLQTFFFGPHRIHFHIEHHCHVRVPFYRLAQVHALMRFDRMLPAQNLYDGYWPVLREVSRAARD